MQWLFVVVWAWISCWWWWNFSILFRHISCRFSPSWIGDSTGMNFVNPNLSCLALPYHALCEYTYILVASITLISLFWFSHNCPPSCLSSVLGPNIGMANCFHPALIFPALVPCRVVKRTKLFINNSSSAWENTYLYSFI